MFDTIAKIQSQVNMFDTMAKVQSEPEVNMFDTIAKIQSEVNMFDIYNRQGVYREGIVRSKYEYSMTNKHKKEENKHLPSILNYH